MPVSTLTFNLPDEQSEFKFATNGAKYLSLLVEITQEFRNKSKYENGPTTWGDAYDKLWTIFKDNNFDPWEEELS
jgi:hypothetical protein